MMLSIIFNFIEVTN